MLGLHCNYTGELAKGASAYKGAPTVAVNEIVEILVRLCGHSEAIQIYHVAANFGYSCLHHAPTILFTGLLRCARNDGVDNPGE